MSAAVLTSQGVRKAYGGREVLRGIDLTVCAGEIVGLVGPNGAGKSTWLRCVTGLTRRSAGSIDVLGQDPARAPLAVRGSVSYLPGETSVYENMRGREFVRFALSFYPSTQQDIVDSLSEAFELPMGQKVRTYSAGMKQKLALIASLAPDVAIYLLDEPDRALDASTRLRIREVLLELRSRGKSIVLSSHHLHEVKLIADRTEFLVAGRMVPTDEIQAIEDRLRRRVWLRLTPGTPEPPGAQALRREPDGTTLFDVDGDPVTWLQGIAPQQIEAAEIGLARLEDLYRELATAAPEAR